ncbi:Pycsar system effector family protein [Streptomyces albus]|uniref:Pycsar system effector family protein n=1 Tax=Streptomyces albus TaxID=1888 RepID=UPI00068EC74D|nr:Pycsar system effector family protein [Streptomyces albus]
MTTTPSAGGGPPAASPASGTPAPGGQPSGPPDTGAADACGDRRPAGPGPHLVAERLLNAVREEMGRADTKASILLSGAMAVLVMVLTWYGEELTALPAAAAAAGVLLWAAGVVMLAAVVMPRRRPPGRPVAAQTAADGSFFADLTKFPGGARAEALLPRVARAGREPQRWMVEQSCTLGLILAVKYRWLRRGVLCLAAGGTLLLAVRLLQ